MNDSRVPQISLDPQSTNSNPLAGYPSCLVDDPVYLVDDSRVLVGSQTMTTQDIRGQASSNSPNLTGQTNQFKGDIGDNTPKVTISIRR